MGAAQGLGSQVESVAGQCLARPGQVSGGPGQGLDLAGAGAEGTFPRPRVGSGQRAQADVELVQSGTGPGRDRQAFLAGNRLPHRVGIGQVALVVQP